MNNEERRSWERKITLSIACGEGQRRQTQKIVLPFNKIYAVASPRGGEGGKGAVIYSKEDTKPLHTVPSYTFSSWQAELQLKNMWDTPVYKHSFVSITPRLMVNMELLREGNLSLAASVLSYPTFGKEGEFELQKEQIEYLTKLLADREAKHNLFSSTLLRIKDRNELRDSYSLTLGCLTIVMIFLIVHTILLITILCMVIQ